MSIHSLRWPAFGIAIATFFLASWIVIPAPTYLLLTFGVGAREVSAWLALSSLLGGGLAIADVRGSRLAVVSVVLSAISLALALSPFARVPSTVGRFDAAMRGVSATPHVVLRSKPLVVADLFRGISSDSVRVTRGIPFANPDGHRLTLDVYQPLRGGPYPIIVQIYGGAWQRGAPGDNADFARWIASAGYVVFAVDYRHAPAARWPALLDDVDSSLAWIRDHANAYGGATSRVALIGRSAGAHLALMAAYSAPPLPIRGVISYYGPTELPDAFRNPPHPDPIDVRQAMDALIGGTLDQMPERYAEASPTSLASRRLPPTLLVYGGADHVVEAKYGARLRSTLAAAGTPVAYLEIPWAEHGFDAVFNGPSSQVALYYTERFLAWATARSESSP